MEINSAQIIAHFANKKFEIKKKIYENPKSKTKLFCGAGFSHKIKPYL